MTGTLVLPTTGTVSGLTMTQNTNSALAALATFIQGGSAPTTGTTGLGSTAGVLWHDTTNNLLKLRDQADANWLIIGAVDEAGKMVSSQLVHGQCQLQLVSATQIKLAPYNGHWIVINGVPYPIAAAGITATSTSCYVNGVSGQSLSPTTLYYVYLFNNSGALTLDFMTTAHATDTANGNIGVEIKSGDSNRSFVGMVYLDGSSHFRDDATFRGLANWFKNARSSKALSEFVSSVNTSSNTMVALPGTTMTGLSWGDEWAQVGIGQIASNTVSANIGYQSIIDGAVGGPGIGVAGWPATAGSFFQVSGNLPVSLSEGVHSFAFGASTNAGTVSFNIELAVTLRI